MGNSLVKEAKEEATMDFPKTLSPIVEAVKKNKKVCFFLGAGVSTSCGIPDFRSPKTGLYANLKKLNLPYPEAVFDIDYFREKPDAFYTLAHELYPGNFLPSKFHFLLKLFQDKKLLKRVYTQNIDTLERLAGIEDDYIVEAHGSFANNHCIDCHEEMSSEELKKHVFNREVNNGIPTCSKCKGFVKPDIVFFGENLPARFFSQWDEDCEDVDIAIVAGSSLTVYPFAGLPSEVGKNSIRLLVNREAVGDFKSRKRKNDILALEDCDYVAETLVDLLGWKLDLDQLIKTAKAEFESTKNEKKPSAELDAKELASKIKKVELKDGDSAPTKKEDTDVKDLDEEIAKLKI